MQFWDLKPRLISLVCCVLFFYAHFFIPLFSVVSPEEPVSLLGPQSILAGIGTHPLHYMTIGLLPFISSGLMLGVFFMVNPALKLWLLERKLWPITQRVTLYLCAAMLSANVVYQLPKESLVFGPALPWLELMASVVSLEWLLKRVHVLHVVNSPVTFFLALNVLGGFAYALLQDGWFSAGSGLAVISALVSFAAYSLTFPQQGDAMLFRAGGLRKISFHAQIRYLHVGVMPFVYASMFGVPLLMLLHPGAAHPAQIIVTSPLSLFFCVLIVFLLSWVLLERGALYRHFLSMSEFVSLKLGGYDELDDFAKNIRIRQAVFSSLLFVLLLVVQGSFVVAAGLNLMTGFVGGVSWLIVAAAIVDLRKGCRGGYLVQ